MAVRRTKKQKQTAMENRHVRLSYSFKDQKEGSTKPVYSKKKNIVRESSILGYNKQVLLYDLRRSLFASGFILVLLLGLRRFLR